MSVDLEKLEAYGIKVVDLADHKEFSERRLHTRDAARQLEGLQRVARAFVNRPETILQELVDTAVDLCEAESAGISIRKVGPDGSVFFHWVAASGKYAKFLDAMLPPFPSACSVCIERGRPQLFRVTNVFFELMGIQADPVTDGLLLPWRDEDTHGTIWIMAHSSIEAFDQEDCRMLQSLADFAAMGVRQHRQQRQLLDSARAAAAAAMANELAHRINNPLQSLTNQVYLAAEGFSAEDAVSFAQSISVDLHRLSNLVKRLLALPFDTLRRQPVEPAPAVQETIEEQVA